MNQLQLQNILEENWNEKIKARIICPYCETASNTIISVTKKSVRIDCKNNGCNKVFFYRRVNLGVVEK